MFFGNQIIGNQFINGNISSCHRNGHQKKRERQNIRHVLTSKTEKIRVK